MKQHVVCIIPARGGSKRIPGKNIVDLAGQPMLAYSIDHALNSKLVDRVIVSTDDADIASVSKKYGAEVFDRPDELAGDTATSESALIHVLDEIEKRGEQTPDLVVFLQCTSPVRRVDDIDNVIGMIESKNADSVFSATRNFGLIWSKGEVGVKALTYDYKTRKREQDMDTQYRENGSIYVCKPELLRKYNNRMTGTIDIYEMDMWSSFQVDSPDDVELINWILQEQK